MCCVFSGDCQRFANFGRRIFVVSAPGRRTVLVSCNTTHSFMRSWSMSSTHVPWCPARDVSLLSICVRPTQCTSDSFERIECISLDFCRHSFYRLQVAWFWGITDFCCLIDRFLVAECLCVFGLRAKPMEFLGFRRRKVSLSMKCVVVRPQKAHSCRSLQI